MSNQIRLYGKNRKKVPSGNSYWTDIDQWKNQIRRETGKDPLYVNVTTRSKEAWARDLSPIRMGPIDTYDENGETLKAVSVEVAWQYSKIYSGVKRKNEILPLAFANPDGTPKQIWRNWRDRAWDEPKFHWDHPDFPDNKISVRRAFPKGSPIQSWFWDGEILDAVTARKKIYAKLYCDFVQKTESFKILKGLFRENHLLIYDIDGYDYVELGMTPEQTIRDLNHSWGHGLLLTLLLQGIDPVSL